MLPSFILFTLLICRVIIFFLKFLDAMLDTRYMQAMIINTIGASTSRPLFTGTSDILGIGLQFRILKPGKSSLVYIKPGRKLRLPESWYNPDRYQSAKNDSRTFWEVCLLRGATHQERVGNDQTQYKQRVVHCIVCKCFQNFTNDGNQSSNHTTN